MENSESRKQIQDRKLTVYDENGDLFGNFCGVDVFVHPSQNVKSESGVQVVVVLAQPLEECQRLSAEEKSEAVRQVQRLQEVVRQRIERGESQS